MLFPSVFWVGWDRSGSPRQHPVRLGKVGAHFTFTSPMGELWAGGTSPGTELCHLRGEVMWVKWTALIILFDASNLRFFASPVCWNLSVDSCGLTKVFLSKGVVAKISISIEERKLEPPILLSHWRFFFLLKIVVMLFCHHIPETQPLRLTFGKGPTWWTPHVKVSVFVWWI